MKVKVILIVLLAICQVLPVLGQKDEKAQKKMVISGKVTDKSNNPVAGAIIFIDSAFTKNASNERGDFRIKVDPSAKHILAVKSDKGFGEAIINGPGEINITLDQSPSKIPLHVSKALKENNKIVARAQKMNTYPNIYEMIRQEVPGVTVSGTSVQIKQSHSFFGSSTPIFVVNGVKVPSIDNIVPTQVKSIKLLTGSQATMYSGVDGAPGVIVITLVNGSDK